MSQTNRRHLALMVPSDNGYLPCMGVVELHDTKVVTNGIADQHLPEWIKAIEAVRVELQLRAIALGGKTEATLKPEGTAP